MKHLSLIVAAVATVCGADRAAAQEVVKLTVGETRTFDADAPVARITIDKPGVVGARMRSNQRLEVTGVKPGDTGLRMVPRGKGPGQAYTIEVIEDVARAAGALQESLRAVPGFENVSVSRTGALYTLSGQVKDLESHARLSKMVAGRIGADFTDMVTVTGGQMVAVDVRFYAVNANTLNQLGFNFSKLDGGIQGGLVTPNSLQSFNMADGALSLRFNPSLQGAFNLLLAKPKSGALGVISALANAGLSQVLAQPTLLVRSGEQAEFLAGGDVPIPVPQGGGNGGVAVTIEYRPYGVRLAVAPVVLSDKRILLKLSPEVSELDYTNQVSLAGFNVPGFRRRSASTTVELGDGQSYVIAGLTYMSGNSNDDKVPGLGDLPVLGALFKTSQRTHQRQELIIVATPRLVNPLDHDPLQDVTLDGQAPSLGDTLLNRNDMRAQLKSYGLSR